MTLHQGYPANKAALTGKQGVATPYQTPVQFPTLARKYGSKLDWDGKVVQSCVHCHMVGDAFREHYRSQQQAVPAEWIFPQPSIDTLGVTLASDEIATVRSVQAGSAGAGAGLLAGDRLLSLNQQPLVSTADVSWVLHRAPETGSLPATVRRDDRETTLTLNLPAGWRSRSDISKRAGTWPMRAMALGGLNLTDLDDPARLSRGLAKDMMALRIKHVGQYGPHAAARDAGFRPDDILVEVDGLKQRITESALIGRLLQQHRPGEKLTAQVLRGTGRVELKLPQQ